MEPQVGSIYAEWDARWQRYAVIQLCGGANGERWWLDLDWFEPELPSDLDALRPLRQVRYFLDGKESYLSSPTPVRSSWVLLGERDPWRSDPPNTHGYLTTPWAAAYEFRWAQHSEAEQDAYRQAASSSEDVQVAGTPVPLSTDQLGPDLLDAPAEDLAHLVAVQRVEINHPRPDLAEVLAGFPFLSSVTISGPVDEVTLPEQVDQLVVQRGAAADMRVHGAVSRLHTEADLLIELPMVTSLFISRIDELDLADVVTRYPRLTSLSLTGAPGMLTGIDALGGLPELRESYLSELFGFTALPHLPQLQTLELDSVPRTAGVQARRDYAGIDLQVSKLRNDTWLADNLNNPFRGWDGSRLVPARYAKAAWKAFRQHRSTLRQAATHAAAGQLTAAEFADVVTETITTATGEFNAWNTSGWIEDVERDEIFDAYAGLVDEVSQTFPVDRAAAVAAFNQTRDW